MAELTGLSPLASLTMGQNGSELFQARSNQLIRQVQAAQTSSGSDKKIQKSAREFESILLGHWLEQAEQSFATLPGSDDDPDADPGQSAFVGLGSQELAKAITASGGIGIAKMLAQHLAKAAAKEGAGGSR
jgi:Rod binding domain-containing protein